MMSTIHQILPVDEHNEGFVRMHLRKGTDEILGATIHPYPARAEAIHKVADQYKRTRLTPKVKMIFAKMLVRRRGH